jgi:hypothetical protein
LRLKRKQDAAQLGVAYEPEPKKRRVSGEPESKRGVRAKQERPDQGPGLEFPGSIGGHEPRQHAAARAVKAEDGAELLQDKVIVID